MDVFCTTPDGLEFILKEDVVRVVDEAVFGGFVKCELPGVVRFQLIVEKNDPAVVRENIKRLHNLRGVEQVCGLVTETQPDYPLDNKAELGRMQGVLRDGGLDPNWRDSLRLWSLAVHGVLLGGDAPLGELSDKILFRCSAARHGKGVRQDKPKYKSPDVERAAGEVIAEKFSWRASMVLYTMQVFIVLNNERVIVGVCLHPANQIKLYYDFHKIGKKERGEIGVGEARAGNWEKYQAMLRQLEEVKKLQEGILKGDKTIDLKDPVTKALLAKMKPSTTNNEIRIYKSENSMIVPIGYALAKLSDIQPGDVVCDPLGGSGTTLIEASLIQPHTAVFGGDVTPSECLAAATNIECYQYLAGRYGLLPPPTQQPLHVVEETNVSKRRKIPSENRQTFHHPLSLSYCKWNAAKLPVRTASVDVVISDLPFGNRCTKGAKKAFPLMFLEFARILRSGGRLTFLAVAGKQIDWILGQEAVKDKFKVRREPFKVNMGEMYPTLYCLERV